MNNFSNFDDEDLLETRENRNSTINRPSIDPGMGDDEEDDWNHITSSLKGDNDFESSSPWGRRNSPLNNDDDDFPFKNIGGPPSGFNTTYSPLNESGNTQKTELNTSYEDKFYSKLGSYLSKLWSMLKEIVTARKTFDLEKRIYFGKCLIISGYGLAALAILGFFFSIKGMGNIFLGSGFAGSLGLVFFMSSMHKKLNNPNYSLNNEDEDEEEPDLSLEIEDEDDLFTQSSKLNSDIDFEDIEGPEEAEELEELESPLFAPTKQFENLEEKETVAVDPLDVIKNMNGNMKMITRQYLYDSLVCCLKNKKSNFSESVVLDEDSREFLSFCKMVDGASETLSGFKSEDAPSLLKVEDKLFYTFLEISRPKWFKQSMLNNFINEIVSICQYDVIKGKKDPKIYGMGDIVGNRIYIKIMKGKNAMISIKDTYDIVKDKVLDLKNKMPVVLGVDEEGDVSFVDLEQYHSLIITGQPRSGKSWIVKAIIFQLMMMCTPSQLQIYIGDAKNTTSDFYFLDTPHIRRFASTDDDIVQMVRDLVHVEAARRTQMFYDLGGYKDIADVHKEHPEVEMPYIYLLIDEVVTLASRMDEDTKKEFQDLLHELTTRLPSLGIRPFLVPHELKDKIIRKSITDMIPFRVSVGGTPALIENAVNAKPSEFEFKLTNKGDMAVRFSNSELGFVHGVVITDENQEIDRLFGFLTNFWLKLEPNSFKGSRMEKDIRTHQRTVNMANFPPEVLEMIEQVQKESLSVNRPTRNKSNLKLEEVQSKELDSDLDIIADDNDTDDEDIFGEVKKDKEKKGKITRTTSERTIGKLNQKLDSNSVESRVIQQDDTLK